MARLLAIEWDQEEARLLLANARGSSLTLEKAASIKLPDSEGGQQDPATIGGVLRSAMQDRAFGKADCVVAVGRSSIELKYLTLPPVPDDELPELVRFQALREFNTLGEDWPLDFLPLDSDASQPRNVLAAAVSPSLVQQVQSTCSIAGVSAQRIVLRPCATASLLRKAQPAADQEVRLLINLLQSEIDLTVLRGNSIVFLRTARVTNSQDEDSLRLLLLEIRRTLAAVGQRLGGERVASAYVCSDGAVQQALAQQIETELGLPTKLFDPYSTVQLGRDIQSAMPEHAGRFAPLIGMLTDEAAGGTHAIDFLHPRKKPAPPKHGSRVLVGALSVMLLAASVGGYLWFQLDSIDKQTAIKQKELAALKKPLEKAKVLRSKTDLIDKWSDSEVIWLEELHELAVDLPEPQHVMLTDLRLSSTQGGTSNIELRGLVSSPEKLADLDQRLQDERHKVQGRTVDNEAKNPNYPFSFSTTVIVQPPATSNTGSTAGAAKTPAAASNPAQKPEPSASAADSGQPAEVEPSSTQPTDNTSQSSAPAGESTARPVGDQTVSE